MTATRSRRRLPVRLAAVLLAVVASGGAALAAPSPARAASSAAAPTQVVQFSTDGIHWSDSYTQQLFQGVLLVPGGSAMRSFYVRNGATEAAILRITLADVSTTSIPLADAMTIASSTAGAPGAPTPVTLAQPCYTLSQGLRLASGDSTRIDNTVALGDLTGTVGQTASVHFGLRVSFSSTDAAAPAPVDCPTDYGTVDTFPQTTPADTRPASSGATSTPVYHRTAGGWTVSTSVGGAPVTTPTSPTTTPQEPSTPFVQALVSNTGRLYQEYDVAFWLAMSVLGAVILVFARRRRAEEQPEAPEQYPNDRQIGTR